MRSRPIRRAKRWKYPARTHLVLIERRVTREPVVVEFEQERRQASGFWRGEVFHDIVRILGRRFEKGTAYMRVATESGCFELHRVVAVDPWTWRARAQWELVAELAAVPVAPFAS
jgi:hypothetical protein